MEEEEGCGEICLNLLLPISTLGQVEAAFKAFEADENKKLRCAGQVLRAFVQAHCDVLAKRFLNQDVMGIVYEYLFGGGTKSSFDESEVAESEVDEPEAAEESEVSSDARKRRMREKRWFEAAVQDDEKLIAQLLEEDPTLIDVVHLSEPNPSLGGMTALHMASEEGCERVVALLLAVKPSLAAVKGNTALHITRDDKIFKILLAVSPSSGLIANFEGVTALMEAVRYGDLEKVQLLLAACPEALDMVDEYQCTALLYAACKHHFEIVSLLLAAKPRNVRAAESEGCNVLHYEVSCTMSSFHSHAEHVEALLAIDPGLVRTLTTSLQTPLWLAVDQGRDNEVIEDLFHRFPHAWQMQVGGLLTMYAVQSGDNFAVNLFS